MVSGRLRIAVAGASGFLGTALVKYLSERGHEVVRLVRPSSRRVPGATIPWNPSFRQLDPQALAGMDAVFNLCGESLAEGRWTEARKRELVESRTIPTAFLAETMARMERPPRVFVSASAIGIYESQGEHPLDETGRPSHDFLGRLVADWEAAAGPAAARGVRVIHPRLGSVLGAGGGMLAKLLLPYRMGMGGRIGTGEQVLSWIALDDALAALAFVMECHGLTGPVNLVAPGAVTNAKFAETLAAVLRRPTLLPLPSTVVSALFGEMGRTILLGGVRVVPRRLDEAGFRFSFPELRPALEHALASL
jgi:hypothetical protein